MAISPPPDEKAELVDHVVAFQGYFKVGRYFFRHSLHQGGQSPVISREVFERGHAAGVLPYDPRRDEVVLIRQFRAGSYVAGRHPWGWEVVAGIIDEGETPEQVVRREAITGVGPRGFGAPFRVRAPAIRSGEQGGIGAALCDAEQTECSAGEPGIHPRA